MSDILLCMRGISKRFDAVAALSGVDLEVKRGSVHALIGENGAGKSTLMRILAGSLPADSGTILLDGAPYVVHGPREARARGVSMIHQELALAPHLTVTENVTLGAERQRFGITIDQRDAVRRSLDLLGHRELDLDSPVGRLGIGLQQIVEIARSLLVRSRLVIMDEPTSSLSAEDTEALFAAIERLRQEGVTIVYISHFLEEVRRIAGSYTVLRDGKSVASGIMAGTSLKALVVHMVGRPLQDMFPRVAHPLGEPLLRVDGLTASGGPRNVSLTLRRGEILGIAGLVGAGRTEALRCLFGLDRAGGGRLELPSARVDLAQGHSPAAALRRGMSMVSENRKDEGLAVGLPIRDNVTLSSLDRFTLRHRPGVLDLAAEKAEVIDRTADLSIRHGGILKPVASLSGGNQQKVALARALTDGCDILLLDEPTRGIDVGSKVEIYQLVGACAARGKGVIVVSSYLPELFGICDTLAVMFRGSLSPVRPVEEWSEESVMAWATTGKL